MPGDELHENAAAGARTGPRHAAPKKPLLTRLHVPAGKAIAIAAMPSAVLMGMGLTPQMAIAKSAPESPFKDGPCVTAPDKQEEAAGDKKGTKPEDGGKGTTDTKPSAEPSDTPSPSPSASKDPGSTPAPAPSGSTKPDEPSGSATPSPSPSEEDKDSGGLLGGIGDALGGLFGGGDDKSEEPTASPSPSASATGSEDTEAKETESKDTSVTDPVTKAPVKEAVKGVTDGVGRAAGDPERAAKDTAHGVVGTADNALPGGGLDGKDADGKKAFPCVVENKQKGADEQPPATVPNDPWQLESSALTLRGLDYKGVVNLTMPNGKTKQALKFTADSVDIGDLHQIVQGPGGRKYHVEAAKGSTSTIRGGTVTMYTERLQGNLFGLIPIVFDPEHPPPINVSYAYFTKVKISQAGQFGGNLTVPGLHQTIEE